MMPPPKTVEAAVQRVQRAVRSSVPSHCLLSVSVGSSHGACCVSCSVHQANKLMLTRCKI